MIFKEVEHYHKEDPETSKEAAETMIKSGKMSEQCKEVFKAFKLYAPCTARQLSKWAEIDYHKVQRRFSDIERAGKAVRSGMKYQGCMIWRLSKGDVK